MKHRLFDMTARVPDKVSNSQSISIEFSNCVMVKDKIAQYHKGRVRPLIFYPLSNDEFQKLFSCLKVSKGALTRENYETFLPYMLPLGYTKYMGLGYVALDIEENRKVQQEYERKYKVNSSRR
ncbi:hypothetical protein SAMN06298216_4446 [Spirosomataceae bacterium TFI 002]|nr:hypothetical protein SAMN06298216_4446 [Spirosomataceae bacterium TFI 002]